MTYSHIDIHELILSMRYVGIFILLVLNGAINFPSSQIIYLIAGYFIGTGKLSWFPVIVAGTLGNTIGNMITYKLVYIYGQDIMKKFLFVKKETLTKLHHEFSHKGVWWLFVGKLVPSIKVFIPTVAGVAKVKNSLASLVFFLGSLVWSCGVTYIGYTFGEHITGKGYAITMAIVGAVMLALAYKGFLEEDKNKRT